MRLMIMEKKVVRFEIQDLLPIGLTFVVAGIGLVYGLNVVGDIKSDFCVGSNEHFESKGGICYKCDNSSYLNYRGGEHVCSNESSDSASSANLSAAQGGDESVNASVDAIKGIAKIPEKMPLIATVVIAAIIIGILVRYLM